jgi:single-strand DNA-binding protein
MNNSLTVVGYVGQAPKIKRFQSGKQMVEFSVAVREFELDENGENKTLWLEVKAFNGTGERVLKTVSKGREIVINGRLGIESYTTAEGNEVSKPVIKLLSFHLCGKKPEQQQPEAEVEEVKASKKAKASVA